MSLFSFVVKRADPASEYYAQQLAEQTKSTHAAIRCAADLERWIPPEEGGIDCTGGREYWTRVLTSEDCPELPTPAGQDIWSCTLFGPPSADIENSAPRLFNALGTDTARLVLAPTALTGKGLLARWLIYLADRSEPLDPDARRMFLRLPSREHLKRGLVIPRWIPITPHTPLTKWWAVRLSNVLRLSRLAIDALIAGRGPSPTLTTEDATILLVLFNAGRALIYTEIVREAAKLVKQSRASVARTSGVVLLSETKVRERVPILTGYGMVSRPMGPNGKVTIRKGVGITDKGRAWLKSAKLTSSVPR